MNRKHILILVIFFALIVSSGCGKKDEATIGEETQEETRTKWTIGMSQCNLGEPWRVQMNQDVKNEAGKHSEIRVIYKDAKGRFAKKP